MYDWFNNNLILIAPDMRFGPFEYFINENSPLYEAMNTFLYELDTGIVRLGAEDIPVKSLPEPLRALQEEVKEGTTVVIILEPDNERIILSRENGLLKAKKLFTYHQKMMVPKFALTCAKRRTVPNGSWILFQPSWS